ncbi:hypothetical protein GHI93_00405 [Lactococcus hircilactis]|uniref:Uncharacterized protein n=1 Tax=Lactococcus hircilactis TaxID=1494462 RepID=A0A7X1Z6E2_9LACT|nr:hypothetical protein [Lactococcus hircilactis]MQW38411.1 hypothetical protein [Lactococcus hircilactis]
MSDKLILEENMDLTFSTAAILSFVPAMSLVINVRFNHNENIKNTKRHQRDALQKYAVDLIGTLWTYADLQVRYFNERLIIQQKQKSGESVDDAHSRFVYQMKSELLQMETELRRKVWNSQIEISKYDFPKLRNRVAKTFLAISNQVKAFEIENQGNLYEIKIKILENLIRDEIKALIKDFGHQTDHLTLEIKNINLWNDCRQFFLKIIHFRWTRKKENPRNDAARQIFGETTRITPIIKDLEGKRDHKSDKYSR